MANSLIQFRADEGLRNEASVICGKLGIDLATYMRMSLARLVQERGIPFEMKLDAFEENDSIKAMREAGKIAEKNGISDMSLEEINAEIAAARR